MAISNNRDGLTLMEVIMAVTITAMIVGILLSALRLGHRSQEKALEREDLSQRMRIVSDRIGWLIRGVYPYMVIDAEGKTIFFSGGNDSVGFVTTGVDAYSDSFKDRPGLKWVRIYRDDGGLKISEALFFDEDALEGGAGEEVVFEPSVKELTFLYYDASTGKGEGSWVSSWRERDYLPSAMKVQMSIEFKGRTIKLPPVTAAIRTAWLKEELAPSEAP